MGEFVRLEVEDGVGTIRLDRPPMNALDSRVQEELRAAAGEAGRRSDVGAVVVYGGPKVFAAGADVKEMAAMDYEQMADRSAGERCRYLRSVSSPCSTAFIFAQNRRRTSSGKESNDFE